MPIMSATSVMTPASVKLPEGAMAFRSTFLKSLRDHRVGILAWGLGLGMLMIVGAASFPTTQALRLGLKVIAQSIIWYNEPISVDLPGGYVNWRYAPFAG